MRSRRCKDYINNFAHLLIYLLDNPVVESMDCSQVFEKAQSVAPHSEIEESAEREDYECEYIPPFAFERTGMRFGRDNRVLRNKLYNVSFLTVL